MIEVISAGESHGQFLTVIIEGIPANLRIDKEKINYELERRQKGYGRSNRMTIEKDKVEILSGVRNGKTTGAPITLQIKNLDFENWESIMKVDKVDEKIIKITCPRPGHADLVGALKFDICDLRDVIERASARETALRVAVGSICKTMLKELGVSIGSYVLRIGEILIQKSEYQNLSLKKRHKNAENSLFRFPTLNYDNKTIEYINKIKDKGDSIGGIFEVFAENLVPGLGSYTQWYKRIDGKISQSILSIPGIKGIEFGEGFNFANKLGSEVIDEIKWSRKKGYYRLNNYAGGIEAGITNGEPIIFRAVMKPIPTINYTKNVSVDIISKKECIPHIERSDTIAVHSASVIAENMLALVLINEILIKFGSDCWLTIKNNYQNYKKNCKVNKILE